MAHFANRNNQVNLKKCDQTVPTIDNNKKHEKITFRILTKQNHKIITRHYRPIHSAEKW